PGRRSTTIRGASASAAARAGTCGSRPTRRPTATSSSARSRSTVIERFRPSRAVKIIQAVLTIAIVLVSLKLFVRAIPAYLPRDWAAAHDFDALTDWKAAQLFLLNRKAYTPEGLAY